MTPSFIKEWIEWAMGVAVGAVTIGSKVITKQRNSFRSKVDQRIHTVVEPSTIKASLTRIEVNQESMRGEIGELRGEVKELSVVVAKLEGVREGRQEASRERSPLLHIKSQRGET